LHPAAPCLEDKQHKKFSPGRPNGDSCLLEPLPLPPPFTGKWLYSQHSHIEYLISRQRYSQSWTPFYSAHLRDKIQEHQPRVVVFYNFSYQDQWWEMAGVDLQYSEDGKFYTGREQNTLFLICKHPAVRGITNQYFEGFGKIIRQETAS
jgi:hypothetical protein